MNFEDVIANVEESLELMPALKRRPEQMPLTDRMRKLGVPGLSVAIIDRGGIAWVRAYGLRQVEPALPVEPDTMMQAGSISKPVAALAVMRCVEEGTLDLYTDVNEYLRSW